jgi:hypothetical protein
LMFTFIQFQRLYIASKYKLLCRYER